MEEQWKDIPGFEELYQASSLGRIRKLKKLHNLKTGIVKPAAKGNGYYRASLCKDGIEHRFAYHRAIALAWIPNPLGLSEINHIDGDKSNNKPTNLEWILHKDNILHALHVLGKKMIF
jgi:hypothetical protein